MKNVRCPCEPCVALSVCQGRMEHDLSIRAFRKNTVCKDLNKYLGQCKVTTKYARLHRTEKILGCQM